MHPGDGSIFMDEGVILYVAVVAPASLLCAPPSCSGLLTWQASLTAACHPNQAAGCPALAGPTLLRATLEPGGRSFSWSLESGVPAAGLDLDLPPGLPDGEYRGHLALEAGGVLARRPLHFTKASTLAPPHASLQVPPAALPPPPTPPAPSQRSCSEQRGAPTRGRGLRGTGRVSRARVHFRAEPLKSVDPGPPPARTYARPRGLIAQPPGATPCRASPSCARSVGSLRLNARGTWRQVLVADTRQAARGVREVNYRLEVAVGAAEFTVRATPGALSD